MTAKSSPTLPRPARPPVALPPGIVAFIASLTVLTSVLYTPLPLETEAARRRRVDTTRHDLKSYLDELRND